MISKDDYIISKVISADGRVTHAFMGRRGGVSQAPYDSLNAALHVGDDSKDVIENRRIIEKKFDIAPGNIKTCTQVHGVDVCVVDDADYPGKDYSPVEADAMITNIPGAAIGVLTADCMPIILYDPIKTAIGVAHAGWRGTVEDVAGETVRAMAREFDSQPTNILAALGPYIGACCFEVDDEVLSIFKEKIPSTEGLIKDKHVDIAVANTALLIAVGLKDSNIDRGTLACTVCSNDVFFSYRANETTGRELSFIIIKEQH